MHMYILPQMQRSWSTVYRIYMGSFHIRFSNPTWAPLVNGLSGYTQAHLKYPFCVLAGFIILRGSSRWNNHTEYMKYSIIFVVKHPVLLVSIDSNRNDQLMPHDESKMISHAGQKIEQLFDFVLYGRMDYAGILFL